MSLLTKASTVTTPTAYDGGVLNSVKPVSRENLLLQSNNFSNVAWIQTDITPTSGQSGYDGSNDAWELNATTSNGNLVQSLSFSGVNTFSFYAKQGSLQYAFILFNGDGFNGTASIDLSDGSIYNPSVYLVDIKTTSVGGGWYRIEAVSARINSDIRIYPSNNTSGGTTAAGSIYIQDAQLQKGITATQYVETTTTAVVNGDFSFLRASAATRVNEQGLIEKERGNLLTFSNDLDNWIKISASVTSGQSGYDGTNDAWRIDSTAGYVRRDVSYSGVNTCSIHAKAGTAVGIRIRLDAASDRNAYFNLSTGAEISHTGISLTATDLGGGWYRLAFAADVTTGINYRIYAVDATGTSTTGNIFVQDSQLEQGLVATDYIETTTAAVYEGITDNIPRINYENGIGSFLLEPQRTNLIPHSEYFNDWALDGDGAGQSVTANYSTSPEGVQNAYRLQLSKSGGTYSRIRKSIIGSYSGDGVFSVYLKTNDSSTKTILMRWGGSGSIEKTITGDWQRFDIQGTSVSGLAIDCEIFLDTTISTTSVDLSIYGAQLEEGYLTSYIPTYGTSVTFASESCNNAGDSSLFNDSEGVLYAEIAALVNESDTKRITLSDGTSSNRITMLFGNNSIGMVQVSAGSVNINTILSGYDTTSIHKISLKYKTNDFALWINGFQVFTDTSGNAYGSDVLDRISFDNGFGGNNFYGKTKMVSTFTEALSDSELECLTSWSSFNRMATAQNYTIE